jgi:hypothetical protein
LTPTAGLNVFGHDALRAGFTIVVMQRGELEHE